MLKEKHIKKTNCAELYIRKWYDKWHITKNEFNINNDYNFSIFCYYIEDLDISYQELSGTLNLEHFTNLKILNCSNNELESVEINDSKKLDFIDCSNNRLEWLDLKGLIYIEIIDCSNNQIMELDLSDCNCLRQLTANNNDLKFLNLPIINELVSINLENNLLCNFDWKILNKETIRVLSLNNNNLVLTNIKIFKDLTLLENLTIGNNHKDMIEKGMYNRFFGSFESLKNLKKLINLDVCNLEIFEGFEYLNPLISGYDFYALEEIQKIKAEEREANNLLISLGNKKRTLYQNLSIYSDNEKNIEDNKLNKVKIYKKFFFRIIEEKSKKEIENVINEINSMRILKHRNLIEYTNFDVSELFGKKFLLLECSFDNYDYNINLMNFLDKHKSLGKSSNWMLNYCLIKQIVKGLSYLHRNNIIHGDLNNYNIIILNNSVVKLTNFNLMSAKSLGEEISILIEDSIDYCFNYSLKNDLYSLGNIIWMIIMGDPYILTSNQEELLTFMQKKLKNEGESFEFRCNILKNIFKNCWKKDDYKFSELYEIEKKINNLIKEKIFENNKFELDSLINN